MSKSITSSAQLGATPGYTLLREEYLDDVKSLGLVFRHEQSGARICVLSSDDENKTFCAAFRTTPMDSTGVPHIIEHTVLCGSRDFPARDPFMQLAKGSLNTFLNAMTYPDKTLYPVASCNDTDFNNLMHVYMDAVFYPNIYRYRQIFQQEGWHYEMENADDELKINGVVYSEMQGAMSSPDSVLFETLQQQMFPDTTYGINSGGDPAVIPTLTYENYLDFHRRYYHPSNSYIFLCGNMDIEERLAWMDEHYLSAFSAIDPHTEVVGQKPFGTVKEIRVDYPIGQDEDPAGKSYFAYAAACGDSGDVMANTAWDFLGEVLLDAPGAPIKQALLDAGIGSDVYGGIETHMIEGMFVIAAKDCRAEDYPKFQSVIRESLEKLIRDGISEKAILAALNRSEFRFREADYGGSPKGLHYAISMLQSWLYDEDKIFDNLHVLDVYAALREKVGTGYFEDLLKTYLLNSTHGLWLHLSPKPGMNEETSAALAEKLAAYKASLSPEEIEAIVAETAALKEYQEADPTYEELHCIPVLDRHDIPYETIPLTNEERTIGGVPGVYHDVETGGITYGRLCFTVPELPAEYLPCLGLLTEVLGKMDTDTHSYSDLVIEMKMYTGSLGFGMPVYRKWKEPKQYTPLFTVFFRVLADKVAYALETASEILRTTHFDDLKRLREIIAETVSGKQRQIQNSGHSIALSRAQSYYLPSALFNEMTGGLEYYWFLQDVLKNYEEKGPQVAEKLKKLAAYLFDPARLTVSAGADDAGYAALEENLPAFCASFDGICHSAPGKAEPLVPVKKNEGFAISSQVTYLVRCGSLEDAGREYTGSMRVVRTAASYEYLYQKIRVSGGAYGCGCGFDDASVYFYSYRDPKLAETDAVYCGTGRYLRETDLPEEELNRYIIGTFASIDRPSSPAGKIDRSFTCRMTGRSFEDILADRRETLDITAETFRSVGDVIDAVLPQKYLCAVGSAEKIKANKDLFDTVITLE
ncbi:MAG: insulinase family protein [Clostridia bacterium]|nr:insulinase family protein [Clostridia bacterium]